MAEHEFIHKPVVEVHRYAPAVGGETRQQEREREVAAGSGLDEAARRAIDDAVEAYDGGGGGDGLGDILPDEHDEGFVARLTYNLANVILTAAAIVALVLTFIALAYFLAPAAKRSPLTPPPTTTTPPAALPPLQAASAASAPPTLLPPPAFLPPVDTSSPNGLCYDPQPPDRLFEMAQCVVRSVRAALRQCLAVDV